MNKILGIFGLLLFVCLFTTVLSGSFVSEYNLFNITRWSALFGILSIGVAFVIITGGIDLSIGSVVGLVACLLPMLVVEQGFSPGSAILIVMGISAAIGLLHGLLITRLDLQPFVVTLCGLLFYRGFARWITDDQTLGFGQDYEGLRLLAIGKPCSWATMLLLGGIGLFFTACGNSKLGPGRPPGRERWPTSERTPKRPRYRRSRCHLSDSCWRWSVRRVSGWDGTPVRERCCWKLAVTESAALESASPKTRRICRRR